MSFTRAFVSSKTVSSSRSSGVVARWTMGLPNWREHISPSEAFIPQASRVPWAPIPVPAKPKRKPRRPVYVEIACPQCLVKQQAANRCINAKCRTMIVWPIDDLIQSQIQRAYNLTGRNAKAAAELLGIPYRTFWRRLQEYKAGSVPGVEP